MATVTYYADASDEEDHQQIIRLLDAVTLDTEIIRIEEKNRVRRDCGEADAEDVYNDEIRYNRLLNRVSGVTGSDLLGKAPAVPSLLSGRIAIRLDADSEHEICYLSGRASRNRDYSDATWPMHPTDMLMLLRDDADSAIGQMQAQLTHLGNEPRVLRDWLDDDQTPLSEASREQWVGPSRPACEHEPGCGPMRVDALADEGETIIEIKSDWSSQAVQKALGQIMTSREMHAQFGESDIQDIEGIILIGGSEWSPNWGWPGGSRAVAAAADRCSIDLWMRDKGEQWVRLNGYL